MRKLTRRETVLLLLGAAALAVWAARPGSDASLPPLPGTGKAKATKKDPAFRAPVVELALLHTESVPYDARGRDLFRYSQRPPSAAELARMAAEQREQERLRKLAEEQAAEFARRRMEEERIRLAALAGQPPPPPRRPDPPPLTVRYLGTMGPRGARIAFFEDSGKELIMAREGEAFLKDFRVVKIGYETVTIGFTRPEFKDDTREVPMSRSR